MHLDDRLSLDITSAYALSVITHSGAPSSIKKSMEFLPTALKNDKGHDERGEKLHRDIN